MSPFSLDLFWKMYSFYEKSGAITAITANFKNVLIRKHHEIYKATYGRSQQYQKLKEYLF